MGSTGESFFNRIKSFAQQEKPDRKSSFMHSIPGLGKKDEKSNIPLGPQGEDESEKQYGSARTVDNLAEQHLRDMNIHNDVYEVTGLIQRATSLNKSKEGLKKALDALQKKLNVLEKSDVYEWQQRAKMYRDDINDAIKNNKSISSWFDEYYSDKK